MEALSKMYYAPFTILLLISSISRAQVISGKVTDSANKPIEFVSVTLKTDTTIIKTLLSDKEGQFAFSGIGPGKYTLSFSIINYQRVDTSISAGQDEVINVQLIPEAKELATVTVSSRKPLIERKVDRLVFNVEKNITTVGMDALDVLGKTPGVRADNNAVSIIGKDEVGVMVDGRLIRLSGPALANFLKSIPAGSIERIEVITTPPANYDAQGNSGLINIVKNQKRQLGYFGSLELNYSQATYGSPSGGLTINYGKKQTTFFGSLNLGQGATAPFTEHNIFFPDQSWFQRSGRKEFSRFMRGSGGIEHTISSRTSIGISYNTLNSEPDIRENFVAVIYDKSQSIDSTLNTFAFTEVGYKTNMLNVHLKHDLDTLGKRMTIDADWFENDFTQLRSFISEMHDAMGEVIQDSKSSYLSDNVRNTKLYSINTNFEFPIKKLKLSFGSKLSFVENGSGVSLFRNYQGIFKPDSSNTNGFSFKENTQAAFISLSTRVKKWQMQGGLRGEYTQTKGVSPGNNAIRNSYFSLFPTVHLTYTISKGNVISLAYSKRIMRPGFQSFNPFRVYYNPYSYSIGNPYLEPAFSYNIELSGTHKDFLVATFSYMQGKNQVGAFNLVTDSSNIQVLNLKNFLSISRGMLDVVFIYNRIPWMQTVSSLNIYYTSSKSSISQTYPQITGWGATFSSRNLFYMSKARTISAGVDFTYEFPQTGAFSMYGKYYFLDMGLRCLLMQKRLQVAINVRDVLLSKNVSRTEVINGIMQSFVANNDSRRLVMSLRYSFGNAKIKQGRTYSGSQTEQGRSN